MFSFIYGDLQSADQALAGVVVGVVVERFERCQLRYELFVRFFLQFCAKFRVRRYFRKGISACRGFDVQAASAAQNRYASAVDNVLVCLFEITLIFEDVVFRSGIYNVHEVIRNLLIFR